MSLDLGAPALEVAIGLSFVFFLLSLIVTWITEWIARLKDMRSKALKQGLEKMLGDPEIAKQLFNHPLAQTDVNSPEGKNDPSYLSPRNFSLALVSILKERGGGSGEGPPAAPQAEPDVLRSVASGIGALTADSASGAEQKTGTQLQALLDEVGEEAGLDDFRRSAEKWFDDAMDRVSGWYTRWAKKITLIVAVVVAVVLNASTVQIVERLVAEPTVRAAVATGAQGAVERDDEAPKATGEAAEKAVDELKALQVPILWSDDNLPDLEGEWVLEILVLILGWAITAAAISLGAPFWFDAMKKLSNVRQAGKKPDPTADP